ncbi:hypothetical protein M9434_000511 [Picochlorum sp. BPE23]|nr:hypothetical protein M9434_000511 [Picochlorum sp. BPE23]
METSMNEKKLRERVTSSPSLQHLELAGAALVEKSIVPLGSSPVSNGTKGASSSTASKEKQIPYVLDFREDFNNHLQGLVQDVQGLSKLSSQGWEYYRRDGCCKTWLLEHCGSHESPRQVTLCRLIGQGSFGKVYYGAVDGLERAVKCIRATWKDIGILISEAEMGCSIQHPNIVKTCGYIVSNMESHLNNQPSALERALMNARRQYDQDEYLYIQMIQEYCECGSLESYIGSSQTLFEGTAISKTACIALILRDVARALAYLHDHGILHGDLSGNNVLLVRDETSPIGMRAKVGDFGRSRVYLSEKMKTDSLGTANFMPPEMLLSGDLSVKTDIYALGILGVEMWTGKKAWNGVLPVQILYSMSMGKRIVVPESIDRSLGGFLRSCLCDDPTDRPTPREALEILQTMIASEGVSAYNTPQSVSESFGESDNDTINNICEAE